MKGGKFLKKLDVFPKTLETFRVRSFTGGAISIISIFFIALFCIVEVSNYLGSEMKTELTVDASRSKKIDVYVDITFPALPCAYISLDAVDVAGETQFEISENLNKLRLDGFGNVMSREEIAKKDKEATMEIKDFTAVPLNSAGCETCYGAESDKYPCCKTCDDVRNAYKIKGWSFGAINSIIQCRNEGEVEKLKARKSEGCRIFGSFDIEKVAGNFHFSPGRSFESAASHIHDTAGMDFGSFNLSHTINHLMFGSKTGQVFSFMPYPVLSTISQTTDFPLTLFQYFVKIVPTSYKTDIEYFESYQYSYTLYSKEIKGHDHTGNPGVYFIYDFSPIKVNNFVSYISFTSFLTTICAIIGGMYTLSAFADSFFYYYLPSILKRIGMGK